MNLSDVRHAYIWTAYCNIIIVHGNFLLSVLCRPALIFVAVIEMPHAEYKRWADFTFVLKTFSHTE